MLNDEVFKLHNNIYRWRDIYYEVIKPHEIRSATEIMRFLLVKKDKERFLIREITPLTIKTRYPKLYARTNWKKKY